MQKIQLVNSLSGRKEAFKPIHPGKVKMYVCGPTVYDHCHVGHAMPQIYFDMIRQYLTFCGYEVTLVSNYTDVNDKITERAQQKGITPNEFAMEIIASCEEDMKAIGVHDPDHRPRVSTSIPDIIAMIETLIANGAAYATSDGDVYYRVSQKADYGKLSNTKIEDLKSGSREIVSGAKEGSADFALWKTDDTEGASWDSPWGKGQPGWHIECSAMSKSILGPTFDLHGGGRDLIFPHHENEVAQSESANKAPFANYWLHSGLLTIDKQKMSKSLGNHLSIKAFLKDWPPEVFRFTLLQHHYRSNIDFGRDVFVDSLSRLLYFYKTLRDLDKIESSANDDAAKSKEVISILSDFHSHMSDDFNTAAAIGNMMKHFKFANELCTKPASKQSKKFAASLAAQLRSVFSVLGLLNEDPVQFVNTLKDRSLPEMNLDRAQIEQYLQRRKTARDNKDFAASDQIRDELASKGIEVRDTAEGVDWDIIFQSKEN